ncbi:MAG: sulfatase [Planctomycetota bacterium]
MFLFLFCTLSTSVILAQPAQSNLFDSRPNQTGKTKQTSNQQAPTKNNVLLIVSDDLKASVLGCYGDRICQTPNIDRLAKSGMLYQRAYCQAMWCAPSRQSFMHSRYQGSTTVNLGSHLIDQGYYTARVGKIYHMRVPGDIIAGTNGNDIASSWTERFNSPGLEAHTPGNYACLNLNIFTTELAGRQSTRMPHRPFVTVQYEGDGSDQPDFKSATKAIEIMRQRVANADEQPFFLAIGLVRPHYPMVAPEQYFEPYAWDKMNVPKVPADDLKDIPKLGWGQSNSKRVGFGAYPENKKGMWSGYYASVTFMDDQVGRILDELDRLGLRDSTTVIFTSDHGYHLGEHEFWQKSNLHEEVTRVPLIIDAPGHTSGQSTALVELMDLFPTIAELNDLPIPKTVQGQSLVPTLDGETTIRNAAISLHQGIAIRTDRYSYIRYVDQSEEFYDMQTDPQQFTNLASSSQNDSTKDQIQEELDRHRHLADKSIAKHKIVLKRKKR